MRTRLEVALPDSLDRAELFFDLENELDLDLRALEERVRPDTRVGEVVDAVARLLDEPAAEPRR